MSGTSRTKLDVVFTIIVSILVIAFIGAVAFFIYAAVQLHSSSTQPCCFSDKGVAMEFPDWVQGPTICATRTYSVSLAVDPLDIRVKNKYPTKIVKSLANDPTVLVRNKETGKLMTVWATFTDSRFELIED